MSQLHALVNWEFSIQDAEKINMCSMVPFDGINGSIAAFLNTRFQNQYSLLYELIIVPNGMFIEKLHWGKLSAIEFLLKNGADPLLKERSNGFNCIDLVEANGQLEVKELLLKYITTGTGPEDGS